MGLFPCASDTSDDTCRSPVTTEVPPGYDGSTNWFKYADAVEEWCDLTKVEARRKQSQPVYRVEQRSSRKDSTENYCETENATKFRGMVLYTAKFCAFKRFTAKKRH